MQLVLVDAGPAGFEALVEGARLLAGQHGCRVGVIGEQAGMLRVMRVDGAASLSQVGAGRGGAKGGEGDVQLARTLFELAESVRHWLVGLPTGEAGTEMLSCVADWLVCCGTENEALVGVYRRLKAACLAGGEARSRRVRLLVLTADQAQASRAHARLNHVAGGFLEQELTLVVPSHPARATARAVAEFDLAADAGEMWLSVADFVHELAGPGDEDDVAEAPDGNPVLPEGEETLESVLENAERAALADLLPQESEPAAPAPRGLPQVAPAAAPHKARAGEGGLRVVETPAGVADAESLWPAIYELLPDLVPGAVVLEGRSPYAPCSAVLCDAMGQLHLWLLVDDESGGGGGATAWAGQWQWARDHRELLALTCRDVKVDREADVILHLVLPAGVVAVQPMPVGMQCHRIERVRWGERTGIVVVAI